MIRSLPLLLIMATAPAATVFDVLPNRGEHADGPSFYWFDYDQDNYALGDDDGYTAGFRTGAEFDAGGASWRVAATWAMFTEKAAGIRCDEAFVAVLRTWDVGGVKLSAGPGMAVAGDLGGEAVQDAWHRLVGEKRYDLAYEGTRWSPAVAGTVEWAFYRDAAPAEAFDPTWFDLTARGGLVAHLDEIRALVALEVAYGTQRRSKIAFQPLVEVVVGDGTSRSARVEDRINVGGSGQVYLAHLTIGLTVTMDRCYGTVGVRF